MVDGEPEEESRDGESEKASGGSAGDVFVGTEYYCAAMSFKLFDVVSHEVEKPGHWSSKVVAITRSSAKSNPFWCCFCVKNGGMVEWGAWCSGSLVSCCWRQACRSNKGSNVFGLVRGSSGGRSGSSSRSPQSVVYLQACSGRCSVAVPVPAAAAAGHTLKGFGPLVHRPPIPVLRSPVDASLSPSLCMRACVCVCVCAHLMYSLSLILSHFLFHGPIPGRQLLPRYYRQVGRWSRMPAAGCVRERC